MVKGKVTFVTSAASGLGQAIALAFEKKLHKKICQK